MSKWKALCTVIDDAGEWHQAAPARIDSLQFRQTRSGASLYFAGLGHGIEAAFPQTVDNPPTAQAALAGRLTFNSTGGSPGTGATRPKSETSGQVCPDAASSGDRRV